ncbi:DUF4328 domain-containing protein [Streptomyces sp. NPDC050617]|uniref:DUF4328 domain-containing protein n=1 Tax=Streptomyces sp. NPDC050617 TaxID=3154628 RepID=UPI00341C0ACF
MPVTGERSRLLGVSKMHPCGSCRAVAVGQDGRCAACGAYQQQPGPYQQQPGPYPQGGGYPMGAPPAPYAPPRLPAGGVDLRRGLATAVTALLAVTIVVLVLRIVAAAGQYGIISDALDGGRASKSDLDGADDFFRIMLLIGTLTQLATAVVWAVWFRRTRLNAEVFAPGGHRYGSGWAAGSWFTPVVNLWFPKQIANDIWRASSPAGPYGPRGVLNAWWVLWIVGNVFGSGATMQYLVARGRMVDADTAVFDVRGRVDAFQTALASSIVACLVLLAAAILAILFVRRLTAMQEQRAMAGPQGGGPMYAGAMPGMPYGNPGYPAPGQGGYGYPGPPQSPPPPAPQAGPYGQQGGQPPYGSGPARY